MGNCTLPCNKKLNDNNEVQVNENPEKSETVGGTSGIKRKKTKFPKNIVIEDIEEEDDKPNK